MTVDPKWCTGYRPIDEPLPFLYDDAIAEAAIYAAQAPSRDRQFRDRLIDMVAHQYRIDYRLVGKPESVPQVGETLVFTDEMRNSVKGAGGINFIEVGERVEIVRVGETVFSISNSDSGLSMSFPMSMLPAARKALAKQS